MTKDLTEFPGQEVLIITVVYPPAGSDPIHRHNAHGFIYVPEGSIVMQVDAGEGWKGSNAFARTDVL